MKRTLLLSLTLFATVNATVITTAQASAWDRLKVAGSVAQKAITRANNLAEINAMPAATIAVGSYILSKTLPYLKIVRNMAINPGTSILLPAGANTIVHNLTRLERISSSAAAIAITIPIASAGLYLIGTGFKNITTKSNKA